VQVQPRQNGVNQRWSIVYVEDKETKTEGVNEEFGFHINEVFYIVSRLPSHKVVEVVDG
jgi:hypothetical protein